MIVKCTNCDAAFTVADEKVKGKKFSFDCPKCSENIIIDNKFDESPSMDDFSAGLEPENNIEQMPTESKLDIPVDEEVDFDFPEIDTGIEEDLSNFSDNEIVSEETEQNISNFEDEIGGDIEELNLDESIDFDGLDNTVDENSVNLSEKKDEEDVTLDLDSLDIDFDNADQSSTPVEPAALEELPVAEQETFDIDTDSNIPEAKTEITESPVFDPETASDITNEDDVSLDLESLDIDLEESFDVKEGEELENALDIDTDAELVENIDESRLSLDDAGISIDQISDSLPEEDNVKQEKKISNEGNDNLSLEDAGLTLDEINAAPDDIISEQPVNLTIDEVAPEINNIPETPPEESMEFEYNDENLPELDIDRYEDENTEKTSASDIDKNVLLDIESKSELEEEFAEEPESYLVDESGKGFINFSVDYSLKCSRLKAFLRLIGLYGLVLIPHLLVYMLYAAVANIVGWLNWIIVLFSGESEIDFVRFQGKTLRYFTSIQLTMLDLIEEKPIYTGDRNIDYPLQMDVAIPASYSRGLAFLRLSGIGIMLISLPHIILLFLLSFGVMLISFIGLIALVINQHWPSVLFDFMVRYFRYQTNVIAFIIGLIDTYPSFRFD